ncbi:MAG: hypothetical protein NC433_14370 [Clostridiales bacterium]|nr:hypothetical protein [Clostridiales bacterium]
MRRRILLIEDQKQYFNSYKELIDMSTYFEVINDSPVFDNSDANYITRDEQLSIIQELIDRENYDIILCDLTLREEEEDYLIGKMNKALSICLYLKNKQRLKASGKEFIFVTTRKGWTETQFRKIDEMQENDKFLKFRHSQEMYPHCPYINEDMETMCGEEFHVCKSDMCFIERLRRLTNV